MAEGGGARDWAQRSALSYLVGEDAYPRTLGNVALAYSAGVALLVLVAIALPASIDGYRPGVVAILAVTAVPVGFVARALTYDGRRAWVWDLTALVVPVLLGIACWAFGPQRQEGTGVVVAFAAAVLLFVRPRTSILFAVALVCSYAVVVSTVDGYPGPASRVALVIAGMVPVGCLQIVTLRRLEMLSRSERDASARVAAANETLQRFVSAPVAEAVLSSEPSDLLAPHRRRVAVVFADLRGFTRFSLGAEPEDVVEVLERFYGAFGAAARAHDATLGAFVGDGVMAFVGDPIPVEDPVGRAVALAADLRERMVVVKSEWHRLGFQLGHGVGIAYGFATLGVVGYEGRTDYTALGSVVNLASRLCGEAADGEVLLDARAHAALDGVAGAPRRVELKGYADPVDVYAL